MDRKIKYLLVLVVFWAFFLRMPGVFWGYPLFENEVHILNHDEIKSEWIVSQIENQEKIYAGYPPGFWIETWVIVKFIEYIQTISGLFENT